MGIGVRSGPGRAGDHAAAQEFRGPNHGPQEHGEGYGAGRVGGRSARGEAPQYKVPVRRPLFWSGVDAPLLSPVLPCCQEVRIDEVPTPDPGLPEGVGIHIVRRTLLCQHICPMTQ